jgi:hypothetical protein
MRLYRIVRKDTGEVVKEIGHLSDLKAAVGLNPKQFVIVKQLVRAINNQLDPKGLQLTWIEDPNAGLNVNVNVENLLK